MIPPEELDGVLLLFTSQSASGRRLQQAARALLLAARDTKESQEEAQAIYDVVEFLSSVMTNEGIRRAGHAPLERITL